MKLIQKALLMFGIIIVCETINAQLPAEITEENGWRLHWEDEFDYPNSELDDYWIAQNDAGGDLLCSRWRENVVVEDGVLKLFAKKESRGGKEWTCGSIWTKSNDFKYGYYEAKYKYAGATGTNNSFWLYPYSEKDPSSNNVELDINEGQYPNKVKTNLHNWTKGDSEVHPTQEIYYVGAVAETKSSYTHILSAPISTTKLRFSSNNSKHFHIGEFRAYAPNANGYPTNALSDAADKSVTGLVNHCRDRGTTFAASGQYVVAGRNTDPENVADGNVFTNTWIAQAEGEKWLEITFSAAKSIGCVQFTNGWGSQQEQHDLISDYMIQYWDGSKWVELGSFDINDSGTDLSQEYHVYGLLWTEKEHIFYVDGKEIRRESNPVSIEGKRFENYGKTQVMFSLAILQQGWAGPVTDAIDGTSMKVDWVRYYKKDESEAGIYNNEVDDVILYPNPADDQITLQNIDKYEHISIMDATAQTLLNSKITAQTQTIDISFLYSGLYFLSIRNDKDQHIKKFIKK